MKLAILPLIALISAATVSARLGLTQPSRDLQKSDGPRLLSPISSSSYPPKRLAFSVCPPKAPNLPEFESDKVSRYCFKNNIQSDCKKCSTEVCDWSTCPFCQNMPGCRRVHKPFRFEVAAGCFKNQLQALASCFVTECGAVQLEPMTRQQWGTEPLQCPEDYDGSWDLYR